MGLLKKPYEISLWEDVWDNINKKFDETRTLTIGSSEMEYLGRAIEPNLVRKTNGEVSFSFKMYYQFVDTTTGETVNNPFVDYIANETKVKLKHGDEWFDLLVKNVYKDSATKSYTYQLVDQHMTELSKNGFDVQLDSKLFNNLGTAEELGRKVLQNTDWGVESEKIVQTQDEALVMLKLPDDLSDYGIYQINDENLSTDGAEALAIWPPDIAGKPIYAFYSSCSGDKPYRFQFIYKPFDNEQPTFSTYSDRIIADQNCQYYIDGITEWTESGSFTIPADFSVDTREVVTGNNSAISVLYRGRRYVYSQTSEYHPGLDMYLQKYRDPEQVEYYKYQKTEYVAPSLIQNVVNNADFKGTSAWKGSKFLADGDAIIEDKPASSPEFSAIVETVSMYDDGNVLADATDVMLGYTAVDDEGANWSSVIGNQNYKPYLRCGNLHKVNNMVKTIVNSGTSDTAAFQQGITEGEQYIFDIEVFSITKQTKYVYGSDDQVELVRYISNNRLFPQIVVAKFDYNSSLNGYDIVDYTNLGTSEDVLFQGNAGEGPVELAAKRTITSEEMQKNKYQIFLLPGDTNPSYEWRDNVGVKYRNEYFILIKKIQFYKFYPKGENGHYTLDDDMNSTEVSYVVEDRYFPVVPDDARTLEEITFAPITNTFTPVLSADGSKKSTVNVKESNYFNAIQAIASTFECWPQLEVNHDATGKIVNFPSKNYSKRVHFKNYVGQKNHVGFKYGVNSKDIKRTIDSNQIVSKLIVKANSNEYAPNGFCTIARAPANSVKDNVLYNFDYYVSQQMLDATALQNDLHIADNLDVENLEEALRWITLLTEDEAGYVLASCTGYYPKMRLINQKLENLQKLIAEKNTPLTAETATYNTYKAMYEAAVSDLEEQQDRFFKLAGCAYNAIPDNEKQEEVMNSTTLLSTLQTIAELSATEQDAKAKYEAAEENMEAYSSAILTLENQQKNAILLKEALNNMFYTRYSRFIQEGTWIDESYLDESLYYNDALSVSYNSAMPKVTYSMNVLSLAGLPGYELFDFKVGDQTFVEDTEFFGYDTTGAPIRAEVTITQTSENLDDPTKNTIQIRNYENQFEDLFQRINATVQSVQYSEGSYKKAAEFVEADAAHKFSFLNDALSAAEAYIGDTNNTVVVDTSGGTGITITDKSNAQQALRLTSGAILLKGTNPDTGEKVWKTGLTAEGISASLVNAGILNTGEINIMNGSEPTFRWDSHGITAYNFDNSTSDTFFGIDKTQGVRFDRFGLYGYSGINGETWHPTSITEGENPVDNYSTFSLTWEGLKVTNEQGITLRIGDGAKIGGDNENLLDVTNSGGQSIVSIKEDGSLVWGESSSPVRALYTRQLISKPTDSYDKYDNNFSAEKPWHKIKAPEDWYISYSYDGGNTWGDPIQIQSANTSEIVEWYYATADSAEIPKRPDQYVSGDAKNYTGLWKSTPKDAGHSAVNKYLWNYEETKLTNGTSKYTLPALIATQPKELKKIYEFYAVDSNNTPPEKPIIDGYDSTNNYLIKNGTSGTEQITLGVWECVDTSTTEASNKVVNQSQHLWNFEVMVFTDNSIQVGSIANIGTGGKGISTVSNLYKRTTTEQAKPTKPTGSNPTGWSSTIPEYSTTNGAYLWTCESTVYSNSPTPVYTDVTLLSREPRNIKAVTEYYQISTSVPTGLTLAADGNSVTVPSDWSTTMSQPSHGESLWNCEKIQYTSRDEEGKNEYAITDPAKIGYIGIDSYTLSLDNDTDTVVKSTNGDWISEGAIVVNATRYVGYTQTNTGIIEISAPNNTEWFNSGENLNYSVENGRLTIITNKITSSTGGEFTFTWKSSAESDASVYAEKKFRLGITTALADYDLVIPQVVYNSSQSGGTISINVLRKDQDGTETLDAASDDNSINLLQKKMSDSTAYYKESAWSVSYAQYRTEDIHFVLVKSDYTLSPPISDDQSPLDGYATFETSPTIIWDEEVVEFTQDGASIKKLNTYLREKPYSWWTDPQSGKATAYTEIGHEEPWWTQEWEGGALKGSYDNPGLKVGDTAYFEGKISDQYSAEGQARSVTLYGEVIAIKANSENPSSEADLGEITLKTTSVIWGGTQGTAGAAGAYLMVKYINSSTKPTIVDNNVTNWHDEIPTAEAGKHTYMTQKMSNVTDWSTPVQITAQDGTTPTITINDGGYWVINGEPSSIKAEGQDGSDGVTPEITIENGNWYINGEDSGQKAQGEPGVDGTDGADGSSIEYVYYRSEQEEENLSAPSYTEGELTGGWTESPQGITAVYKYEYMSLRTKPAGTDTTWSSFSNPVIWSKWGEKGQDGDGVSYEYYLSNSSTPPTYDAKDSKWTDDPSGVSEENQYEYVVQIKTTNTNGTTTSTPSKVALWAKWGATGASPYTISLDEDFVSIPATADGTVVYFPGVTITPVAYLGQTAETWTKDAETGLGLFVTLNGLSGDWTEDGKQYQITGFGDDVERGTATFTLRKDKVEVAKTTFEAVKQKQGTPGTNGTNGTDGTYVYAKATPNTLHVGSFSDVVVQVYKRVGSGEPTLSNDLLYYTYSVDGKPVAPTSFQKSFIIDDLLLVNLRNTLQITIYSDPVNFTVLDKITIEALHDGEGVYILYHDANDDGSWAALPDTKDYSEFPAAADDVETHGGWYTTQTDDSVYMIQKTAKYSTQADTDWGSVVRISGTLTTNADILAALSSESTQGIHTYNDNGTTKIGINATAIKAGALCVGNAPTIVNGVVTNWNNNKFYADVENGTIHLAAFEVTNQGLIGTWTKNGTTYYSGLRLNGAASNYKGLFLGSTSRLGNDAQFSVSNSGYLEAKDAKIIGHIEATSGKIGNLTIDDINRNVVGKNLLNNTEEMIENSFYNIATYPLNTVPIEDENYTISFFAQPGQGIQKIFIFNTEGTIQLGEIELEENAYESMKYYSKTFKWVKRNEGDESITIWMYDGNLNTPNENGSIIKTVKLEKGETATEWCKSDADLTDGLVPAISIKNNFSWKMSPTEGFYMYNGNPSTSGTQMVFGVYNKGTVQSPDYQAYLKGEIIATSGKIGGVMIDQIKNDYEGRNLLVFGGQMKFGGTGGGIEASYIADGSINVTVQQIEGSKYIYFPIINSSKINDCFEANEDYTISFEMMCVMGGNSKLPEVYIEADGGYQQLQGEILYGTHGKVYYTGKWSKSYNNIQLHLRFAGLEGGVYNIKNAKLEKGNVPSAWTPAPEDEGPLIKDSCIPAISINNNFSWEMSPTQGFYMYNGVNNSNNLVLGVYKPANANAYQAYLNGEIVATSGSIGNGSGKWGIDSDGLSGRFDNGVGYVIEKPNTATPYREYKITSTIVFSPIKITFYTSFNSQGLTQKAVSPVGSLQLLMESYGLPTGQYNSDMTGFYRYIYWDDLLKAYGKTT